MQKFYITHQPVELLMALTQAECLGFWAFLVYDSPFDFSDASAWFGALGIAHFSLAHCVCIYVFLFTMSGSRARGDKAAKREKAEG